MTPLEEVEALFASAASPAERRTVMSRAYYASFRTLVGVTGRGGFDQDARDARSVHRRLREFLSASPEPVLRKIGRRQIGPLFDLRVRADCRFTIPITQGEAEVAVSIARDIQDWIDDAGLT